MNLVTEKMLGPELQFQMWPSKQLYHYHLKRSPRTTPNFVYRSQVLVDDLHKKLL